MQNEMFPDVSFHDILSEDTTRYLYHNFNNANYVKVGNGESYEKIQLSGKTLWAESEGLLKEFEKWCNSGQFNLCYNKWNENRNYEGRRAHVVFFESLSDAEKNAIMPRLAEVAAKEYVKIRSDLNNSFFDLEKWGELIE